jgi:hypothetical protein
MVNEVESMSFEHSDPTVIILPISLRGSRTYVLINVRYLLVEETRRFRLEVNKKRAPSSYQ